jgi:alpha-glucuronidase
VRAFVLTLLLMLLAAPAAANAEDGYDLWLRYRPDELPQTYRQRVTGLIVAGNSPTMQAARGELQRGLGAMLERPQPVTGAVRDSGRCRSPAPCATGA